MCRSKLIDLLLAVPPQHPFERPEYRAFVNVRQAALARQQMSTAFNLLLDRVSHVELAGPMELPIHEPSFFLRPMRELNLVVKGA